jgi:hypothetical protein
VCDTLCVLGDGVTLFAKNSDRPRSEPQVVTAFGPRRPGGGLATQYLEIPDNGAHNGAHATLLSRPTWLWGAEHGLNEHRLAIGNEMIFTVDDASKAPPALLGMDLVRLGLERATTAEEALEAMTTLLERHGQGGIGDRVHGLAYWSSFLISDPTSAWVLETSGSTWAARPVAAGAAISNSLTLRRDWTRASADVVPGTDVGSWRHGSIPTGFADVRRAAGSAYVDGAGAPLGPGCDPRAAVAALRDHGTGPWGAPGLRSAVPAPEAPVADEGSPDGTGWSLCLHAGQTAVTTSSMVALLPADGDRPARAWVALGSPCVSVYLPVPAPGPGAGADGGPTGPPPPAAAGDPEVWSRLAAVRDAAEGDAAVLGAARDEMAVLEDSLWDEADGLGSDASAWASFGERASSGLIGVLDRLAAAGIGAPGRARESTGRLG